MRECIRLRGWATFLRLIWGKLRRCVLARAFGSRVRRHLAARRRGECRRCGACCLLGRRCPALSAEAAGLSACRKYGSRRDPTCELFPMNESDLRDRDLVMPGNKCGYFFIISGDEGGPPS